MEEAQNAFNVMSVGEVRKAHYRRDESIPGIRLDSERVPEPLRPLIPLAEKWGISNDTLRLDAVRRAPADEVKYLKQVVRENDDALDSRLAGPEATSSSPSTEYLAFTHMRMAADGC